MHPRFRLEIYDIDSDTLGTPGDRLCYIPSRDIVEATELERINAEWTLDFTLDRRSHACDHVAEGKAVHRFDTDASGTSRERFVIRGFEERHTEDGKLLMDVHCEHRSRWLMAGTICRQRQKYDDVDVNTAMNMIMNDGGSGISAYVSGSTLSNTRTSLDLDYQTVLEAVRKLADETESIFYNVDADEDNIINLELLSDYGTTYPTLFRYGKNQKAITKTVDWNEPATRVVPMTGGEPAIDVSRHRLMVGSAVDSGGVDNDEIYLETNYDWAVPSDGTYEGLYIILWDTQQASSTTEYQGPYEILASYADSGGTPWFEIAPGTVSGWGSWAPDYCTIGRYSTKPTTGGYVGIDYIDDAVVAAARGPVVERLYTNDDMSPCLNLVQNATIDDPATWTGGLCPGWSKTQVGLVTCTKNTTPSYIMHGEASMHVTTTTAGDRVWSHVYYTEGRSGKLNVDYLSLTLWLYLVSGSVNVYVNRNVAGGSGEGTTAYPTAGNEAVVTSVGWNRVVIGAIDPQTAAPDKVVTVVVRDYGGGANFYVDSLMMEPYSQATEGFFGVSGRLTYSWLPTELMRLGASELVRCQAGTTSYRISIIDLEGALPRQWPADGFEVGDTAGIYDEQLGIDVQKRIVSRQRNVMNPLDTVIELDNSPRKLTDILAQHELDRLQLQRMTRAEAGRLLRQSVTRSLRQGYVVEHATTSDVITKKVVDWEETLRYPAT